MPPRRRARGAARAAAVDATAAVLLITDLPPDALGHVLARLQSADQIARAAMSCKGFKAAAKLAEDMRVAASPVPLPPQLRTVFELEPRLRVLRWAEAVGAMTKSTLGPSDMASVCISPRDGALCAWGSMSEVTGMLRVMRVPTGIPLTAARPNAVKAATSHVLVLDTDGAVWGIGGSGTGLDQYVENPTRLTSLGSTRIMQVAAGEEYSLFLTDTGGVLGLGCNNCNQLGLGKSTSVPVAQPTAVQAFANRRIVDVCAGFKHSAAVDEAGTLWTWGDGEDYRLGHGDSDNRAVPTAVSTRARVAELKQQLAAAVAAENYGAAADISKDLKAHLHLNEIRQVAVGSLVTLAVTRCGRLYSWGGGTASSLAALGLGLAWKDDDHAKSPTLVAALEGNPVRHVSCDDEHVVVLTEAGEVYTMGEGDWGQLGHGDTETKNVPTLVVALSPPMTKAQVNALEVAGLAGKRALQSELTRRNLDAGGDTAALAARLLDAQPARGAVVVEVAAGVRHTLARTADGKIFSWGNGALGRLGHGDEKSQLVPKQIEAAVLAVEEEEGEEEE